MSRTSFQDARFGSGHAPERCENRAQDLALGGKPMGFGHFIPASAVEPKVIRAFADGLFQVLHRRPLSRRQLGKATLAKSERGAAASRAWCNRRCSIRSTHCNSGRRNPRRWYRVGQP
jgi:hypothetical protein